MYPIDKYKHLLIRRNCQVDVGGGILGYISGLKQGFKPFYLAISLTKSRSCRQILPKLFTFCRHVGIFRANFAFIARFSTFFSFLGLFIE